ncbi:MAG: amidohydrolase family protein [Fusobacteriaceae bacterium]|jgi:N-acyl-D-amino-acid deacylase|nr:amidohydrolase family protein [Fusobacteriaceae bacterium]
MTTAINNGTLIDPANRIFSKLNIGFEDGVITSVSATPMAADRVLDASGKYVCPGFVDLHMHEDYVSAGEIRLNIFHKMLKMGVTTAIGGNCGICTDDPARYLDLVDRGNPIHFGMLLPHEYLRRAAGVTDRYGPVSAATIREMSTHGKRLMKEAGLLGVSFGIRYVPGADFAELSEIARLGRGACLCAHVRDDAAAIFPSIEEFLSLADGTDTHFQISHIGSMAGFGQMRQVYAMVDETRAARGLSVSFDCYPYGAFCTAIGAATYDEGFLERYGAGYGDLEVAEGPHKGERCTEALFREIRAKSPGTLLIAHVMQEEEIAFALANPNTVVASDGILGETGDGHPRAAGTFPRFLSCYVRDQKTMSLYEGIRKITAMPADILGTHKGRLSVGADADLVIFDYEKLADRAAFAESALPPEGIDCVIVGGEIAYRDGVIRNDRAGRSVRKAKN